MSLLKCLKPSLTELKKYGCGFLFGIVTFLPKNFLPSVNTFAFFTVIDGSGSYRINDVFESDIDKYITLKGTLVT